MRRHILGVVAATVAAPYLIVIVAELPFDKTDGPGLLFGMQVATGALMFFGIPTLILAGICAAILYRLKLQTRGWCMLGGAGVGLSLLGLILLLFGPVVAFVVCVLAIPLIRRGFQHPVVTIAFGAAVGAAFRLVSAYYEDHAGFWQLLIQMALAGALCGWIYRRIARERTSPPPGAIEAQ